MEGGAGGTSFGAKYFPALGKRNFRIFWLGQCVSLVGTWMQNVGQSWLVLELTGSPAKLGLVSALQFLPMMLFSLLAGPFVDRFPKRRTLVATQGALLVLALALATLTATGLVRYWMVLVLAFLLSARSLPAQSFLERVSTRFVADAQVPVLGDEATFDTGYRAGVEAEYRALPFLASYLRAGVGSAPLSGEGLGSVSLADGGLGLALSLRAGERLVFRLSGDAGLYRAGWKDAAASGVLYGLRAELGDLLLQVVFHARIAAEDADDPWTIDDVADGIVAKLVARHPHVFGDETADTAEDVEAGWHARKMREKGRASVTDGIPSALPALVHAGKVVSRTAPLADRLPALPGAAAAGRAFDEVASEDDFGDLLVALVDAGRARGYDAESAARRSSRRRIAAVRVAEGLAP